MSSQVVSLTGYILSSAKYQDKDAIISLLTPEKIYSIRVRGGFDIASKNHSATLIFNKVTIDANKTGETFLSATGVKTLENHTTLYTKILPNLVGQLAGEVSLKVFAVGDSLPYEYYRMTLDALEKGFDPLTLAFIFACQGIKAGISPEINECVNCGKKTNLVSFSYDEGGFLCQECAIEANYPTQETNYLKAIRYGFLVKPDQLTRAVLPKGPTSKALKDTIEALEGQLGITIKSYKLMTEAGF